MIYSVLKEFSSIFVDYLRLTVLGTRLKDSLVLLILGHSGDQINVWRRTFDRCFVIWKSGITEWLALFFSRVFVTFVDKLKYELFRYLP